MKRQAMKVVAIRAGFIELRAWKRAAREQGKSLGGWMREQLARAAGLPGPQPLTPEKPKP
jgi:hypothetical protein